MLPTRARALLRTLPVFAMLACAPLLGCDDPVLWITQPGDSPVSLDPPRSTIEKEHVVSGSLHDPAIGEDQAYLARLSTEGEVLRSITFAAHWIHIERVELDRMAFIADLQVPDTDTFVPTVGLLDEGANLLWSKQVPGATLAGKAMSSRLWTTGTRHTPGEDDVAFYTSFLASDGSDPRTFEWTSGPLLRITGVVHSGNTNTVLAGTTGEHPTSLDGFLLEINPVGEIVWTRTFPRTPISALTMDAGRGRAYFTGLDETSATPTLFVAGVDTDGKDLFWKTFETDPSNPDASVHPTTIEYRYRSATDEGAEDVEELLVAGSFNGRLHFDLGDPLVGPHDGFLVTLDTAGQPTWQLAAGGPATDTFSATFGHDDTVLAALQTTDHRGSAPVKVEGHELTPRGDLDTAVMQIQR